MFNNLILPEGHKFSGFKKAGYKVIYADPPWRFRTHTREGNKSVEKHYPTMALKDIIALPVKDLAAPDCHLFLWITGPFLAIGAQLDVLRAWGFKPSSMAFVWVKTNSDEALARAMTWEEVFFMGQGFTTRQNVEYCILGRRGSPKRLVANMRQIIVAPRRQHSRKPDGMYGKIETYAGDLPRLEMFSRTTAPGWDVWGRDKDMFQYEQLRSEAA